MTVPPPKVLAMVVCDQVHEDPSTGKYTILGTFDRVASPSFPYTQSAVTSFMQVTNGRGGGVRCCSVSWMRMKPMSRSSK